MAIVAPESPMLVGAIAVSVPPHIDAEELANVSPVGKVSVNATPVSATVFAMGFVMVKVSDVVPLRAIAAGLNALAIDGGATTLMLAEAVPPVPPFAEVTLPVVLFWSPPEAPVTFIENVHELLCARVVPDRLMTLVPCAAVIAPPPQIPV